MHRHAPRAELKKNHTSEAVAAAGGCAPQPGAESDTGAGGAEEGVWPPLRRQRLVRPVDQHAAVSQCANTTRAVASTHALAGAAERASRRRVDGTPLRGRYLIERTARRRGKEAPSGRRHAVGDTARRRGDDKPSGRGNAVERAARRHGDGTPVTGRHAAERTARRRGDGTPSGGRHSIGGTTLHRRDGT